MCRNRRELGRVGYNVGTRDMIDDERLEFSGTALRAVSKPVTKSGSV